MIKQCITYLFALILGSILVYSLTALAIAPINVENPVKGNLEAISRVLAKLSYCESSNNPNAYVHDDGGSPSAGLLQFKLGTFGGYWKELINADIEDAEILNLWHDPESQLQLATEMLKQSPKNLRHWKICTERWSLMSELLSATPAELNVKN